jgi:CheY-like chemotaxis protein
MEFFNDKNILIVDDDTVLRETVEKMLVSHFENVFHACDGVEALKVAASERIDVLLSDIEMPNMDGFQLLGKIRWNHPDLPIVVMSGNTFAISRSDELKYQGYCFVQKPFQTPELYSAIETAYKAVVSPEEIGKVVTPGTKTFKDVDQPKVVYKKMDSWMQAYSNLLAFRRKYPNKWPKSEEVFRSCKLGYWVKTQRKEYQEFTSNKKSKLTQEKVDMLNSIGFIWVGKDAKWLSSMEELIRYRDENPDRWPKCVGHEKDLGKWCAAQRREYRRRMSGEPTSMDDYRVSQLESIGFKWEAD